MPPNDSYTDVVELCALLQCLGFSVKSLDTCDVSLSQDPGAARTVVINCQFSGWNVVLESAGPLCSCPATSKQNSGVWQVSGVTGGKQLDKEFGCTLLGSLPKAHRERLSEQLQDIIRCIKQFSGFSDSEDRPKELNKSASMIELSTPEKRLFQPKLDTPTRYRSLDTLTTTKNEELPLPAPRPLQRYTEYADDEKKDVKKIMCRRQSTYTVCSTPGSSSSMKRNRNKTSSPIQSQHSMLDSLIAAEKAAEDLKNKIAFVIREFVEEKNDSSISSLVLDVSKISHLKAETSKAQFASSPNLSALGSVKEEFPKSRLKRFESASTSNLAPKLTPNGDGKSKLRRLSPNIFKLKKDSPGVKAGPKGPELRSKLNSMFKSKIVTPVQNKAPVEASPTLSASKRKFSHVKSTIPRPTKKE